MRLWAEERKLGTLELLMTFPVKAWAAVLAKFIAGLGFVALALALTLHLPFSLYFLTPENGPGPDFGPIVGGSLGALVLGMVYLSSGAFASSLTSDQIIASVIGILLCFVFFLMGYQPLLDWIRDLISPAAAGYVERFGVNYHFESIARGVLAIPAARRASAIPGSSFSQNRRVASGVTSRGEMPVPPVVRMKSAPRHSSRAAAILSGSSGTIRRVIAAPGKRSSSARSISGPERSS
jgi:ABC-type transport system involved in multi-copper enzyme maturation permease subunit